MQNQQKFRPSTLKQLLSQVAEQLEGAHLHYGHGTDNAWDEAVLLVLSVLNLPLDIDASRLNSAISSTDCEKIYALVDQRIQERIPLPYLIHEAYFASLSFYVDERVLIPRSPIAELIERSFVPWINPEHVTRILDLCAGSACIAIACAKTFPQAVIDAVEMSEEALEVAKINVEKHQVSKQVNLIVSDLFDEIKGEKYDLIISNPPYVSEVEMQTLPPEYSHEPEFALEANDDGLAIVHRILHQASSYLTTNGILVVEVGNSREALEQYYPKVPFMWLEFERGGDGVFLLTEEQLKEYIY